jgi:hypothetical protein
VLHVGFLVLLASSGACPAPPAPHGRGPTAASAPGLAYLRRSPRTLLQILGVGIIGVGVDPITTLTPALAAGARCRPGFVGTLASAFGVGAAALGFVVLSRVRLAVGIMRLGAIGLALMGVGTAARRDRPAPGVAVVGIAIAGVGMTFSLNAFTTLVQADVPDLLRGRVMALWSMAFLGSRPVTALTTGWLTDTSASAPRCS